jgi:predicted HTH transcriptional regulator
MPTDFLDEKRTEITARLKELKPLVAEFERLEAAAVALDSVATPPVRQRNGSRRRTPARATASAAATATTPRSSSGTSRRGRPKGSGKRRDQALVLVRANPGITIPEIAEKLSIKQNYLYRVLADLAGDGLVVKNGHGWHPKEGA